MPGRTRGIRNPTPGAKPANESGASSTSSAQNLAPSDHHSDSEAEEEERDESLFFSSTMLLLMGKSLPTLKLLMEWLFPLQLNFPKSRLPSTRRTQNGRSSWKRS